MRKLLYILRHEFRMAAVNRAYVVLTVLGPFLILAVTVLPTLVNRDPGSTAGGRPLAVLSGASGARAALTGAFGAMDIDVTAVQDAATGKAGVLEGRFAGFLLVEPGWPDPGKAVFYSRTGMDASLFGTAKAVLGAAAREERILGSGIDPALVARVLAEPAFEVVRLESGGGEQKKTEGDFLQVLFVALSFVMLLYMTVLLYGQLIGRSVVAEKTSKTVEVMLSSVTARELMFGKILGLGLAGILQYGIWVTATLLITKAAGPALGITVPPSITPANLAWLVVFFLLAFFLYASAYAALGAASEDDHHLGQLAWPLIMFLMVPLVMISSIVMNPESTIAVVLSLFPMTSPVVMLVRLLVSPPAAWQIVLCLVLLAAAVAGMSTLAAKVLRVGILMTGKRAKPGEILRWIRVR